MDRNAGMVALAVAWGAAAAAGESVETQPEPAAIRVAFPSLERSWALEEAAPFLEEHLLPELRKELRGTVALKSLDSGVRTARFRRDVESAAGHAVLDYVERTALDPLRERLGDALERALSLKRDEDAREPAPVSPHPPGEARVPRAPPEPRRKKSFDFDLDYSGGRPAVELQYTRRGLDLEVDVSDAPQLKLAYERHGTSLRLGVRAAGAIGLEYRRLTPAGQSNMKVDFDATRDRYSAAWVIKF